MPNILGLMPLLSHIVSYRVRANTDNKALSSLVVSKRLKIPLVHGLAVLVLSRHCERSEAIFRISRLFNGLDSQLQRMRKIQEIAAPLSRLAMTSKWDSGGLMHFV